MRSSRTVTSYGGVHPTYHAPDSGIIVINDIGEGVGDDDPGPTRAA
jgi:hypothetical protein